MTNDLSKLAIPREICLNLVEKYVSPAGRAHLFYTEAAMGALAREFGEDEHTWAMCGLLHDIDYEQIVNKENWQAHMKEHCGEKCVEFLREINFPEDFIRVIQSHNEVQNVPRDSRLAKALFAVDGLTGFIVAVAKVMPDKQIFSVKPESVIKRFNEKSFAAGVNREHIFTCETELEIPKEKFVEIVLESMKKVNYE